MTTNYFDNKTAFLEPSVKQYGSSMVMTNVTKPRRTKFINIDTRFQNNGSNKSHNHIINFPERLMEVNKISVSQIEIPMSFFNISFDLGNSFFLLKNVSLNSEQVIEITDGDYTTQSLITSLNKKVVAMQLSFIEDPDSSKIFVQNHSNYKYRFDFNSDNQPCPENQMFKSKLGWIMGFRRPFYIIYPNSITNAESIFDTNSTRYLYLILNEFSNSYPNSFSSVFTDSFMDKSILARISINKTLSPYGTILFGNENNSVMKSDIRTYAGKIDIQRIDVQLVNEFGKPINLNGLDFSFLLKIEHE